MMKIADVRSAVLGALYRLYEAKGPRYGLSRTQLEEGLDIHKGMMAEVLRDFRDRGILAYQATAGGPTGVHLTAQGIEDFENPQSAIATYVQNIQHITFNAQQMQNVQTGHGSTMNVTYTTVLQQLAQEIETSDIPADKKSELLATVQDMLAHPFMQTILTLTATALMQK